MHLGKVSGNILKRSVLKNISYKSKELYERPSVGADCTGLKVCGQELLFTSNPVFGVTELLGKKAFFRMLNDVNCCGGQLSGIMCNILLPADGEETQIKCIMRQLGDLAAQYHVDILGGHTEVSKYVNKPILTIAGIGFVNSAEQSPSGRLSSGNDIVMTGFAGAFGAAERVYEADEELAKHFPKTFLNDTMELAEQLSCENAAKAAFDVGGVTAMHNASAQGVFGALWEMADRAHIGLAVDVKKIPICQEAVEIAEFYGENPYMTESAGVLLIGTTNGEKLVEGLKKAGIRACVIGKVTDGNDRVLINGEERSFLVPPGK